MHDEAELRFEAFVVARWAPLVRTAFLLTGDHALAEDLAQTALVRTHRHWRRVEAQGDPTAYVRQSIYHLHVSQWRRRFRGPGGELLVAVPPESGGGRDAMGAFDERDRLWAALRDLPPRMRAVVVLRHLEGASEAETAALLGLSPGTVKSATSRGLSRLRATLSDDVDHTESEGVLR